MNYLLAKVNDKFNNNYKKVISNELEFFTLPNLTNHYEFTPSYKLNDGEWFTINNFSKENFCIDLLINELDTTAYREISNKDFHNISYLCAFQDDTIHFQRVFKRSILEKKTILLLGDSTTINNSPKQIILSENADAIYKKNEDTLYFRKLETIAPIFPGIYTLYREATNDEIENFLNLPFIEISNDYNVERVGKANRQRISLALEDFNNFTLDEKKDIFNYTSTYYPQLKYNGTSFTIGTDEDMKHLLYGLEQRYYTTPVTKEKRLANSVKKI